MDENRRGGAGSLLLAAYVVVSLVAPGCKRDEPETDGARRAPAAEAAAPAPAAEAAPPAPAGVVAAGSGTSSVPAAGSGISSITMDAADQPETPSLPLSVVFGSRGAGVAWVARRPDGLHVVHNGRPGRAVTFVDQVSMSPDGSRIAYSAEVDGAWRMVVDGEVGVQSSSAEHPVFSPDGRHVAYVVSTDKMKRVVVDRNEGPKRQDVVGPPVFSADSTLVAFAEVTGEGLPSRLAVSDLSFSEVTVKANGVKQFVANGARTALAVVAEEGKNQRVLVLGFSRRGPVTKGPLYDAVSSLAFGPDGATVAYVAEKEGRRFLVLGAKEAPLPEGSVSSAPVIRPDGAGVGVIVASDDGHFLHEAFVAAEARNGQRYEEAGDLAYAADGRSNAFCARTGESWFVVANGREGPQFDRVVTPSFSRDGKLLVYRARKGGRRFVVVSDANGRTVRQHPAYEQVFPVLFMADGRSIAYGVKDGRRLAWKVEPL